MAGGDKSNDTKAAPQQYQFAQKPEELSGWEGFKKFLWNSEKSEVMGRTGSSWCKYPFFIFYMPFFSKKDLVWVILSKPLLCKYLQVITGN